MPPNSPMTMTLAQRLADRPPILDANALPENKLIIIFISLLLNTPSAAMMTSPSSPGPRQ